MERMHHLRFLFSILFAVGFCTFANAQQREVRSWTNTDGKTIKAALVSSNGKSAVLRLNSNRLANVPLDSLSKADQQYVSDLERHGLTAAIGPMPSETAIDRQVKVTGNGNVFDTENFRFTTDRKVSVAFIAEASRIFEGTLHAVDSLPFGLNPKPPEGLDKFQARFVGNEEFKKILAEADVKTSQQQSDAPPSTERVAGVYIPAQKEIVVPYSAIGAFERGSQMTLRKSGDSSTLIHEITHQVVHDWLTIVPVWFTEGLSEYVASVPYQNGRFDFKNIDRGLTERLNKKYRGMDHKVKIPLALLQNTDANAWGGSMDDYRQALTLVHYLVHYRSDPPGQAVAGYLNVLDRAQTDSLQFIEDYNAAAAEFEKKRLAFNKEVETYNSEVNRIQKLIADYNDHVNAYNSGERSDTPVKPTFSDPEPPVEIELPKILKENGAGKKNLNIFSIANEKGREALLRGQTLQEFVNEMATSYQGSRLPLHVSTTLPEPRRHSGPGPVIESALKEEPQSSTSVPQVSPAPTK